MLLCYYRWTDINYLLVTGSEYRAPHVQSTVIIGYRLYELANQQYGVGTSDI